MLTGAQDEIGRLQALRKLAILDTECEAAFDELTKSAALVCQVPIALISLIDEHRQWFKSRVGLDACETRREFAFCAHAIRQPHELMEINDATTDSRFADNPLVTGPPAIRFYAGAPLVDADGHALGTLCVIDIRPRVLEPWQREVLGHLARQVTRLFAARQAQFRSSDDSSSSHRATNASLSSLAQQVPTGVVTIGPHGRLRLNATASKMIGFSEADLSHVNQWFEKLYGEQAGQLRQIYDAEKAQGFPVPNQSWIISGDGQRRLIEKHSAIINKEEFWLIRDVTETIGAEERFRVLFEYSSDAHLLFDENGIIDCNKAAITLLHYQDKKQILSLHPARLSPEFQPDGRRSDEKCIEMDRLAHEKGSHRFEWQHRRNDGTDLPVEVTLTPVILSGKSVLLVVWHDLTERKLSEQAGREKEQRWLLALQATGDGLWDWDLESNRVFFSLGWKRMLGYQEHEVGDTLDEWDKRLHPEDKERTYADIKRHLSGEIGNYHNEHRALCRDGTWKWILDRGMVVERYSDGRPKRMVGTHTDLTDRRKVEATLRLEQERFRAMSDASPAGIFVTDNTGAATYLNNRWCALAGITEIEGLGAGWAEALHPDDKATTFKIWSEAVVSGGLFTHKHRFLHRNGQVVWTHVMAAPMVIGGQMVGYIGTVLDITESYHHEQHLINARNQLLDAIGAIDAGFAMFDAQDKLVVSNQRFSGLYGLDGMTFAPGISYDEILGKLSENGAFTEEAKLSLMNQRRIARGETLAEQEYRLAGRWIRIAERRTADNGMVILHTDVTALKNVADEMRKARDLAEGAARAKADFLATMSHELRTPMNGVIGMTSLLLDTPLDRQQKEYAETARACGDQLLTLINDILDFSKIEAGSLTLEKISYSPRHLAEESVALLADQAEKKGLQIICLISADVPLRLTGDPTRLRQITLNLLSNAVKFTERGEIVLSISLYDQNTIDISVSDTGVGISPQASQRLFQPFVQADSSTTRKYGGTGLGLVICQRLVQLMGGAITLNSVLGQGSTFVCRLPLNKATDEFEKLEHQSLVGCHALVIAPSATVRRSLREQLISWGMSCDECHDESGIPAALARRSPALVVIDHQVTDSSLPLAQKITPSLRMTGIPIILLVGGAQRGMAIAAKEAGFSGFLTKPIRQAHLFECLLLVLNQTCTVSERPRVPTLVTRHTLEEDRSARRILLVEDNVVNRQVAVAMLNKLGYRCDITTNGQEAVEAVAQHDYQMVFMDCQMPILDGFEATKAIRLRETNAAKEKREKREKSEKSVRHVRIIALTANAMEGDRERCLAAGMDDYLTKPIKITDLETALNKPIVQPQAETGIPQQKPSSVAVPQSEIIDDAAMQDLLNATDQETLKSVVELIRVEAVTILVELRTALDRGDPVGLGRSAHRFKGAVGTLGLRRVHQLCAKIEDVGRARELSGVAELIQALERALVEAMPVLANHPLVKVK